MGHQDTNEVCAETCEGLPVRENYSIEFVVLQILVSKLWAEVMPEHCRALSKPIETTKKIRYFQLKVLQAIVNDKP